MHRPTFAYMAYNLCRTIYKIWPSTTAWLTLPYETLQERFNTGARYDALGSWPASLCATDPETNISKEISDEEVKASCAEVRGNIEDPDGRWLIKKLFYLHLFEAQTNLATVTGYTMYSLIRPAPSRPTAYLYIDPVGVVLIMSLRETSADTLAFLVDHDVQVPAKFVDKITKRKIDAETNPQHHTKRVALKHLDHADYMGEGQQSLQKNALALLAQSIPSLLHQREHHQPDATPGNQPLAT
eukprot:s4429_g2.t1